MMAAGGDASPWYPYEYSHKDSPDHSRLRDRRSRYKYFDAPGVYVLYHKQDISSLWEKIKVPFLNRRKHPVHVGQSENIINTLLKYEQFDVRDEALKAWLKENLYAGRAGFKCLPVSDATKRHDIACTFMKYYSNRPTFLKTSIPEHYNYVRFTLPV